MIDYEILKVLWWVFIGVLLVGFAVMDGQDMGVGTLLPFLSKEDRFCPVSAYPVAGKPSEAKTGQNRFFSPAPISPEGFAR